MGICSYCIDIITATPKMSIAIFILQICMSIKNHQRAFSLQISHKLRHAQIWWNTYKHMDMVRARFRFMNFYPFQITKLS